MPLPQMSRTVERMARAYCSDEAFTAGVLLAFGLAGVLLALMAASTPEASLFLGG